MGTPFEKGPLLIFDKNSLLGEFDRQVPRKPRLVGGVKGHNINEMSFPGSPALWAGSFTYEKQSCMTRGKKTQDIE